MTTELLPKAESVLLDGLTKTIKKHILEDVAVPDVLVHTALQDHFGFSGEVRIRFWRGFNMRDGAARKYKK